MTRLGQLPQTPTLLLLLLLLLLHVCAVAAAPNGVLLVAPKVWRAGSKETVCVTVINDGSVSLTSARDTSLRAARVEPATTNTIRESPAATGSVRRRSRPSLSQLLNLLSSRRDRRFEEEFARPAIAIPDVIARPEPLPKSSTITISIGFASSKNGASSFEVNEEVDGSQSTVTACPSISVPDTLRASYIYVKVPGKKNVWSEVRVESKLLVTLVQTDKAKYRPGQTVKLRIVSLRQDFTALDDTIKEVWITAPEGTRLAQWRDVRLSTGLVQMEFRLTQEPPLGRWLIHVRREAGAAVTQQPFIVEEFVPPRFELTVAVPGVLYRDSRVLTVKVCAKYTFGKPLVAADVRLLIANKQPNALRSGAFSSGDGRNKYSRKTAANGCVSIYIVSSDLHGSSGDIPRHITQYLVSANVTEAGTGISQIYEIVVPVRDTKLFKIIKDETPKFIKPHLNYYGTVRLERQDGSPVKNERVRICYKVYYYKEVAKPSSFNKYLPPIMANADTASYGEVCTSYTTDGAGRVIYVVPAQNNEIAYVTLEGRVTGSGQGFSLPRVLGWYSPSGSFLLLDTRSLLSGGRCGQTVSLPVLRSPDFRSDSIQYLAMARGDIVTHGPVRSDSVSLTLNSKMTPSFQLLIYALTNEGEGEVVADSKTISVAPCLPNKVSVSWSAAEARPGDTATLTVTGSPGSLCGVDAVDRSAQLLGTTNTVSVQKVFSQVSRLMIAEDALPKLKKSSYDYCSPVPTRHLPSKQPACEDDHRYNGVGEYRIPYEQRKIETTLDSRDDSTAAFDLAGFLAVTDLKLQTRPCIEYVVTTTNYKTCYGIYKRRQIKTTSLVGSASFSQSIRKQGRATSVGETEVSGGSVRVGADGVSEGKSTRSRATASAAEDVAIAGSTRGEATASGAVKVAGAVKTGTMGTIGTVETGAKNDIVKEDTEVNVSAKPDAQVSTSSISSEPLEPVVRFFFPETFIFQLEALGSSGRVGLRQQLPDSITRWIGSAVCSHRHAGLGISPPSSIKVFKPFFAEINVPYSVKRGELLQLKVSVFNFLSKSLSVVLRLESVPGVQLQDGNERALCVSAEKPSVSTFPVLFTELGQQSLVVSVQAKGTACGSPNDISVQSDALVRDVLVKPEGFPQEEALTERICTKPGGSATHVFDLGYSPLVVPGSPRAVISIYGDPLGQAITQLTGLESLVRVPHGCGEQNMVLLVPNILVHQYMKAKDMLSDDLKKKTVDNMLNGYQRQLRYRHSDGSYSAFGQSSWRRSEGSLWLTVYVLRWFAVARQLVPIDASDLAASVRWVQRHQRSDGCFNRVGWLYDKAMSGGVADGGRLALTAFTVLALLEADRDAPALRRAVTCLRGGTPRGLYAQVLVTHALLAAGERAAAAAAVPSLLRRATRAHQSLHWRSERSGSWGGSAALDVEITAYMTMTLLQLGGHEADVRDAVRWLDRRRNGHGGWVSTQDTVVALSALVAVERAAGDLGSPSLEVTVSWGRSSAGTSRKFRVTKDNRLLHQQTELRPLQLPASVSVTATGSGCLMAQTVMRYSLKETKAKQAFEINHSIRPVQLCQSFVLQVCAAYTAGDAASNMAIIEIEMLSGFVAIDHVLQGLERSGVIRRWEVRKAVLSLYLDQLVKQTLCLDIHLLQEAVVQRLKPATIAVYDYYTTQHRRETEYELPACG